MARRVAYLFAGQGAQAVGMGRDLAESSPAAKAVLERADLVLGRPLSTIMLDGPDADLTRTANCQPALYVHGLMCRAALEERVPSLQPAAAAGLSLGEFTAHAVAGTFGFDDGLRLVERRGTFMDEACRTTRGAMAAMIGSDETTVRSLAADCDVDVANLNAPGQIVISGEAAGVAMAVGLAKERGIRMARELNVAGAYHSRLMRLAHDQFGPVLAATPMRSPAIPVVSNIDGRPATEPNAIRQALHDQVTGTVRWTDCVEHLLDSLDCDLLIELGPGGVLAGLANRIRKAAPVLTIGDQVTLDDAVGQLTGPSA